MKVIDLLNKIANGEEIPEIIKVMGCTYYLCRGDLSGSYYFSEKQGLGGVKLKFDTSAMEEEVKIIEEDKKIEKIDFDLLQSFEDDDDKYISIQSVCKKIDEIIDYLNKEE